MEGDRLHTRGARIIRRQLINRVDLIYLQGARFRGLRKIKLDLEHFVRARQLLKHCNNPHSLSL
jgi:hypothetical protein